MKFLTLTLDMCFEPVSNVFGAHSNWHAELPTKLKLDLAMTTCPFGSPFGLVRFGPLAPELKPDIEEWRARKRNHYLVASQSGLRAPRSRW